MSVVDTQQEAREFTKLLREYTAKLEVLNEELSEENGVNAKPPADQKEMDFWIKRKEFRRDFEVSLRHLANGASQLLEHADLPTSAEIELKLLLGEYEYHYFKYKTLIQA